MFSFFGRKNDKEGKGNYTLLSQNIKMNTDDKCARKNNNILIVGGSGSGKGRSFVLPNLLEKNCSYVVNDPYGEMSEKTRSFFINSGYTVMDLKIGDDLSGYNPFDFVENETGVFAMSDVIIDNIYIPETIDIFSRSALKPFLFAVMMYVYKVSPSSNRNFAEVFRLLKAGITPASEQLGEGFTTQLDVMFDNLRVTDPDNIALASYVKSKGSGRKAANEALKVLCEELAASSFSDCPSEKTSTLLLDTVKSMGYKPTVIFVHSGWHSKVAKWALPMLFDQMIDTLRSVAKPASPIHIKFILDEFQGVGRFTEFRLNPRTMDMHNMSCNVILQSLWQLKYIYGNEWKSLVGLFDTVLYFGCHERETISYISEMYHRHCSYNRLLRARRSHLIVSDSVIDRNKTLRKSGDVSRYFLDMPYDECLVLSVGCPPFFDQKFNLKSHSEYSMLFGESSGCPDKPQTNDSSRKDA